MKLILLSGGSGKRLWPLSNDLRSKQFLRVLPGPVRESESMVQRVWRQIHEVGLDDHAYVVSGKDQAEMIYNQVGAAAPLITEPERRDTFAAIMLAASYLHTQTDTSLQETIVVMPVDPYVEVDFFLALRNLDKVLQEQDLPLALIGAKPSHPSEKYGYILLEESISGGSLLNVKQFVEKPNEASAKELISQGALWNCGVFAGKLEFFIRLLQQRGLPTSYMELQEQYTAIPKISFDYEVVEKLDRISVLPYFGYWKDLGTWNTLTEEMGGSISGKGRCSQDSTNTHIVNELDIPIAVLGVSNIIVAASPDGILIADKEESPRIKEILSEDPTRPMYVERHWGWYRVLEYGNNDDAQEVLVRRVCIHEGENLSYHKHILREECWTLTAGSGEIIIGDKMRSVKAGDIIRIPKETLHSIRAIKELQFIETQIGDVLIEEDIYRV